VAKTELPMGAVANTERSALKDGLATQVRRPLTSILGVSLALQHNDPESRDGRELVRQLGTNARKLDRMVGVLLEIDRLADGTLSESTPYRPPGSGPPGGDSPDLANRNVHVEAEKVVVPVGPSWLGDGRHRSATRRANVLRQSVDHVSDLEGAVIAADDTGSDVPPAFG
jgi:hypothetical protein